MPNEGKKFVRDSFITLTRQLMSIVIGMLLLIILARFLGKVNQGYYTTITLLPTMLMTFLNLGINTSTIYYVSKKEIDINSAVKNNMIFGMVLGIIGMIVGLVFIMFFSGKGIDSRIFSMCLIALPFMMLNIFFQTIFQGVQNFKVFNTILVITQISTLVYIVVFLLVFNLGLLGSIIAFVLGQLTTTIFIIFVFKRGYQVSLKGTRFSMPYFKKSIKYGLKSHISNVMTLLNYRTALLMLIFFVSPGVVGVYSVAVNLAERLSIFSQSISSVLLPKIASSNNQTERNKLTSIVSRIILIVMVLGTILAIVLSDFIIALFGSGYKGSSLLFKILLPGIAFLSVEKILSNDIAGRGKPEVNMYVSIINIVVNVTLNLIFIPMYGAVGAALGTTITYIVSFMMKCFIFKKVTGEAYRNFLILKKSDLVLFKKVIQMMKTRVVKT